MQRRRQGGFKVAAMSASGSMSYKDAVVRVAMGLREPTSCSHTHRGRARDLSRRRLVSHAILLTHLSQPLLHWVSWQLLVRSKQ